MRTLLEQRLVPLVSTFGQHTYAPKGRLVEANCDRQGPPSAVADLLVGKGGRLEGIEDLLTKLVRLPPPGLFCLALELRHLVPGPNRDDPRLALGGRQPVYGGRAARRRTRSREGGAGS